MSKQQNKTSEVYSTSGFKDTLASPVFGCDVYFWFCTKPTKVKGNGECYSSESCRN